jgi:hypothetical protein
MEIYVTTGARYFPQFGPFVVPEGVWTKRLSTAPSGALRLRAERRCHGAFFEALINMTVSDLSGTDRMRTSASEP